MFEKVVMHLAGNKTFTIEAKNNSTDNKYIQSGDIKRSILQQAMDFA